MSTLKVGSIRGVSASSDAITVSNDGSCTANITNNLSNRNLVINGAMEVAQRGTSFTNVGSQEYTLDRFVTLHSYGGTQMGVSQSSTSPDGFSNSYKLDVNTADTSIGAAEFVFIRHKLEAQNLQQLAYGTSGAKSITLSFYVRSNVTGTYAICLQQKDNSSKQVNGSYTINSADTWERKTFTYAGDTSGVINNDTGTGFEILWYLAAGSNRNSGTARSTFTAHNQADEAAGHTANILSSTSNNFHLTGVQLEANDATSDFEHISFAEDLRLCQRYFYMMVNASDGQKPVLTATCYTDGSLFGQRSFPVTMRANPSVYQVSSSAYYRAYGDNTSRTGDSVSISVSGTTGCELEMSVSGTSVSRPYFIRTNDSNARIGFSAEL